MKNHSGNRAALPVGTRLRQYRIDDILGMGGFGVTYLAHDSGLQAPVAIKEFFPNQFAVRDGAEVQPKLSENEGSYRWGLKRFLGEARALAKFRHPNIVRVLQVFEGNNTAYMVLDYEDGERFGTWLDDLGRRPTESELRKILMPLLAALEKVHGQKLLHRDIAPDNIIIRSDESPVLLDFGAARQAIGQSLSLTAIFKPGYSPPEQYLMQGQQQGEWTDIYALSATLYRAINGKSPPESIERVLASGEDPMKPLQREGYSAAFISAVEAGLSVRSENRPQTIAAWREMFGDEKSPPRSVPVEETQTMRVGDGQSVTGKAKEETVVEINVTDWKTITLERARQAIAGGYDVGAKDDKGGTPLHWAAWRNKNPEIIGVLFSAGAEVSTKDDDGWTPLDRAVFSNKNPEVIGALLSAGADVSAKSDYGATSLHRAAFNNKNPEIIGVLLSAGTNVNAKNDFGETPLHLAAEWNGSPEIIRALLSAGADVSAKADDGWTPLHYAAWRNENPEIIGALLSAGADVSAKTDDGRTPLHSAAWENENPEIIGALCSSQVKTDKSQKGIMRLGEHSQSFQIA